MLRKLFYTTVVSAGLAAFFFGRDAVSYVRTGAGCIKDSVRDSVPVRFEFQRARNEIEALAPEIRKNMMLIAREEVEIERLHRQVEKLQGTLSDDRAQLTRLTADLQQDSFQLVYGGRRYTEEQVKADLANRFKRVKTNDTTLASLRKVLEARQRSLEAARQKLEQSFVQKRQLMVEIENLEARQKMVEVAQTAAQLTTSIDQSQVSRTRELVDQLATRIEVAERMVGAEGNFEDEIPMLDAEPSVDIIEQVVAYLKGEPTGEVAFLELD